MFIKMNNTYVILILIFLSYIYANVQICSVNAISTDKCKEATANTPQTKTVCLKYTQFDA